MARQQRLCVTAVVVLAFLVPLVAARPGGRLCHSSFFFPDPNNARTVTLVGDVNGGPQGFKVSSFASNGFFGSPSNLVEVRLLNLHKQMIFSSDLPHSLDLGTQPDKPFVDAHRLDRIFQTWVFSTNNPHHPITWIDIRSRRALWRPEIAVPHVQQKPLSLDDDSSMWVFAISFVFGFIFFLAVATLIRALLRNFFSSSHEEHDFGFLYGYQELPSSEVSEKEAAQKEFTKETATKAENV